MSNSRRESEAVLGPHHTQAQSHPLRRPHQLLESWSFHGVLTVTGAPNTDAQ
jgi:hypothetical protein